MVKGFVVKKNAANCTTQNLLVEDTAVLYLSSLFFGDSIDHNILTTASKCTCHGMGMTGVNPRVEGNASCQ